MVGFISPYSDPENEKFDGRLVGHGSIYGSTECGKSTLIFQMIQNGVYSHVANIVILTSQDVALPDDFVSDVYDRLNTKITVYKVTSSEELSTRFQYVEETLTKHRQTQYAKIGAQDPGKVDMRPAPGKRYWGLANFFAL